MESNRLLDPAWHVNGIVECLGERRWRWRLVQPGDVWQGEADSRSEAWVIVLAAARGVIRCRRLALFSPRSVPPDVAELARLFAEWRREQGH